MVCLKEIQGQPNVNTCARSDGNRIFFINYKYSDMHTNKKRTKQNNQRT